MSTNLNAEKVSKLSKLCFEMGETLAHLYHLMEDGIQVTDLPDGFEDFIALAEDVKKLVETWNE